jgi:hypothetical protein
VTPCLHLCVYYHIVPISSHSHGSAPPHFCHKNPQQTQGVFLNLDLKPKSSLCSTLWLAFLPQTNYFAKGQQQKDSAKLETKGIIKSHPSHSLDQICTKLRIHLTAFLLVFPWHCIFSTMFEGRKHKIVDVHPNGSTPVGCIMLCVVFHVYRA